MNATHTPVNSFLYEQSDVPAGTSLREWRQSTGRASARRRRPSLITLLHPAPRRGVTPAR
ncbi:MAG: hypothetical protein QOE08_277 [Thermoleophilaceae bacterium]|jgi:hypothetical protein|nr:hypothetical protein [Thermoleophilaceae bacterium]